MSAIKIGIIGDFDEKKPSHRATVEAISHCASQLSLPIETAWLSTVSLKTADTMTLCRYDAFFCAPGSPYLCYDGALSAIRFAREGHVPFLGTCGGFQHAVMEYAQNVLNLQHVYHEELAPKASNFLISLLSCSLIGTKRRVLLKKGTMVQAIYGKDTTVEMFNCHYGLNTCFVEQFEQCGFLVSGMDENGEVRIFELPQNVFFVATLFQPQLSSTPAEPHPLLLAYLLAAKDFYERRKKRV